VVDGGGYSTSTSSFPFPIEAAANTSGSSETGPKAYLNWLVFDRDYNLLVGQCGYDRLSGVLKEQGQDATHERLFSPEITITEPGYVYIYLSNEETAPVEVYFDDLRVEHIKSPIVSTSDYYAFGMQFNNFEKENSAEQKYLYNLKELQDELNLEWYDYGARMYYPAIARWMAVDPLADQYRRWSPYNYAVDNPVKFIDPDGMGVNDIYALDNMTGAIEFVDEQEGDDVLFTTPHLSDHFWVFLS